MPSQALWRLSSVAKTRTSPPKLRHRALFRSSERARRPRAVCGARVGAVGSGSAGTGRAGLRSLGGAAGAGAGDSRLAMKTWLCASLALRTSQSPLK